MITILTEFKNGIHHVTMSRGEISVTRKSEDWICARCSCVDYINDKLKGIYSPIDY